MGPSQKFILEQRLKKCLFVADEGETEPLLKISNLFDEVNLLLGQAMKYMLKGNATTFQEAENMLFGPN